MYGDYNPLKTWSPPTLCNPTLMNIPWLTQQIKRLWETTVTTLPKHREETKYRQLVCLHHSVWGCCVRSSVRAMLSFQPPSISVMVNLNQGLEEPCETKSIHLIKMMSVSCSHTDSITYSAASTYVCFPTVLLPSKKCTVGSCVSFEKQGKAVYSVRLQSSKPHFIGSNNNKY